MSSNFGFASAFPGAPLPFPIQPLCPSQTLAANATQFPNDFFFPGVPNIIWAVAVPGYGGTDVISFRFNGDSGANYWDNVCTIAPVAASGTTAPANSEVATVSTSLIRLGLPINKWRIGWGQIINQAAREKGVSSNIAIGSATPPTNSNTLHLGAAGGWDGAAPSKQINQVTVLTAGGLNMLAGTQVWFFSLQ
jgi:hypothetical protein